MRTATEAEILHHMVQQLTAKGVQVRAYSGLARKPETVQPTVFGCVSHVLTAIVSKQQPETVQPTVFGCFLMF